MRRGCSLIINDGHDDDENGGVNVLLSDM